MPARGYSRQAPVNADIWTDGAEDSGDRDGSIARSAAIRPPRRGALSNDRLVMFELGPGCLMAGRNRCCGPVHARGEGREAHLDVEAAVWVRSVFRRGH